MLHQCTVHEPTARGTFAREVQMISLQDVTRAKYGKVGGLTAIFIDGRWLEIEQELPEFLRLWEAAKARA